jgi:hypothetical protein
MLKIKNSFSSLLAAASLLLAATAPSHAGVVVVIADPEFGSPFADLGWRAEGALYVPDSCLTKIGTGSITVNASTSGLEEAEGACNGSRLQDVKIFFYAFSDASKSTVETLNVGTYQGLAASSVTSNTVSQELIDFSLAGGLLTNFHTSLSFKLPGTSALAGSSLYDFSLEFSKDNARLVATGRDFNFVAQSNLATVTYGAFITDAEYAGLTVPEPATWGITLLALGLAASAGRRRSQRSA